jgi:gliding motility-associated-like protein
LEVSSYAWNLIDTVIENKNKVSWCYTKPGQYNPTFNVTFQNGCVFPYNANASIYVWPVPDASFEVFPLLSGNKIKAMEFTNTTTNSDSIVWNFGDGSPEEYANFVTHTYPDTGLFKVLLIAYSDSGCADTAEFKLHIEEKINVPNVFTPNGDGTNDVFSFDIPNNVECLILDVYDRWGKLKFHNDNFKNDWKGTDQSGKLLNPDTYFYVLNFCRRFTITGFVVIMYDK